MPHQSPGRPRLLIAEDDAALAETMREVLEADFAVYVIGDSTEAVAQARRHRPDVLVIDANMPRMDGFAACRALRDAPETADMAIIMVTGDTAPGLMHAAFAAGATDYLQKPFSVSQLRARAATCVMRRHAS